MNRWVGLSLALPLIALTGCASTKQPPQPPATAWTNCDGRTVLIVRNHTDYAVEIVRTEIGSRGRTVISIVNPGYRELEVQVGEGVGFSSRRVRGNTPVSAAARPRAQDSRTVDFGYACQ
jgi:hypothetical protein